MSQVPSGVEGQERSGERQSDEIEVLYEDHWLDKKPAAGMLPEYSNPKGTRYIALGGDDASGAVKIVPIKRQGNAAPFYRVSARQPYVGFLEGPFRVEPIVDNAAVDLGGFLVAKSTLDVRAFERIPCREVKRGVMLYEATVSEPAGDEHWINVRGRARTVLSLFQGAGGVHSFIIQYAMVSDTGINLLSLTRPTNAGGELWHQISAQYSATNVGSMNHAQPDYVRVVSITPGAPDYKLIVEAWD